jgi:phospholipid-binding lipoprotein MlaA
MRSLGRKIHAAAVAVLLLNGCAETQPQPVAVEPPMRPASAVLPKGFVSPLDVYDPLEPVNRRLYIFNAYFDEYVFLPVVDAYEAIVPEFAQERVSHFFDNLGNLTTIVNAVLQLKPDVVGETLLRFVVNTTVGLAGLFDPASELGLPVQVEDFGQTLGYWGAGAGPYLVLPVLGPSNLRDTTGRAGDWLAVTAVVPSDVQEHPAYVALRYGLEPIDTRRRIGFRYYETGSPFEYELVRLIYTKKREVDIRN